MSLTSAGVPAMGLGIVRIGGPDERKTERSSIEPTPDGATVRTETGPRDASSRLTSNMHRSNDRMDGIGFASPQTTAR